MVAFGVLGPVRASTALGPVPLKGPQHRAVLARLLIAQNAAAANPTSAR